MSTLLCRPTPLFILLFFYKNLKHSQNKIKYVDKFSLKPCDVDFIFNREIIMN